MKNIIIVVLMKNLIFILLLLTACATVRPIPKTFTFATVTPLTFNDDGAAVPGERIHRKTTIEIIPENYNSGAVLISSNAGRRVISYHRATQGVDELLLQSMSGRLSAVRIFGDRVVVYDQPGAGDAGFKRRAVVYE